MGLTADGLTVPREADLEASLFDALDVELATQGLDPVDRERPDSFVVMAVQIVAAATAEAYETVQAIYDSRRVNNATGLNLADLLRAVGVPVLPPTYSTVTATLGGTAGLVVNSGRIVEGGGDDDKARWILLDDVTLPGDGAFRSENPGPFAAAPGEVDKIVTALGGWDTVTNAAASALGRGRESDAQQRARRAGSVSQKGSGTTSALRATLLDFDFVTAAVVLQNQALAVAVVQGVTMQPAAIAVYLTPSTITTAQKQQIVDALHRKGPSATEYSIDGVADVTGTAIDAAGGSQVIAFKYGSVVPVPVASAIVLEPGFVEADVLVPYEAAVADYFAALNMGDAARIFEIMQAIIDIDGIQSLAILIDGVAVDKVPAVTEQITLSGQTTAVS